MSDEQSPAVMPVGTTPPTGVVRSRKRRLVLTAVVVGALAAIIATVLVLDSFVARLLPPASNTGSSTAELPDCGELYPEWTQDWLDGQLVAIREVHGSDANGVAVPWRTPETFPAAAIAWAGLEPGCGSTMVVDVTDDAWLYRLDVDPATHAQVEALSSLLGAMGYSMTYDEVPRELLQVGGESEVVADEGEESTEGGEPVASWYREFANEDGWIWMTFYPTDPAADEPVGDLVIGYEPAG